MNKCSGVVQRVSAGRMSLVIPPRPRIFYYSDPPQEKDGDFWYSEREIGYFPIMVHNNPSKFRAIVAKSELSIVCSPDFERVLGRHCQTISSIYMHGEPIPPLANAFEHYASVLTCRGVRNYVHLYVSGEDEGLVEHVFGGDTRVPKWIFCFHLTYYAGQLIRVIAHLSEDCLTYHGFDIGESRTETVWRILLWLERCQRPRKCISLLVDALSPLHDNELVTIYNEIVFYGYQRCVENMSRKSRIALFELFFDCISSRTRDAVEHLRSTLPRYNIRIRSVQLESTLDTKAHNWAIHSSSKWLQHAELRYLYHVERLTSSVLALFPLHLPAYVLLWILDLTSAWFRSFAELRKISHIQGVLKSCRAIVDNQLSCAKREKK
jgi:hypothetical protein